MPSVCLCLPVCVHYLAKKCNLTEPQAVPNTLADMPIYNKTAGYYTVAENLLYKQHNIWRQIAIKLRNHCKYYLLQSMPCTPYNMLLDVQPIMPSEISLLTAVYD